MITNPQAETAAVTDGRLIAAMQKLSSSGRVVTGDAILSELTAAGQTTPQSHGRFRYNTGRKYTGSHPQLTGPTSAPKKEEPKTESE